MMLIDYIHQGGSVMYILVVLSVLALALILYKTVHFLYLGVWSKNTLVKSLKLFRNGEQTEAIALLARSRKPAAKVARCIIDNKDSADVEQISTLIANQEVSKLERNLPPINIIAQVSPLIGLLGTILGMISAFIALEQAAGNADPVQLAGGIWIALLTTAGGLVVAIPSLAFYMFAQHKIEQIAAEIEDTAAELLQIIK